MPRRRRRPRQRPLEAPTNDGYYQQLQQLTQKYQHVFAILTILLLFTNLFLFIQTQSLSQTVAEQKTEIADLHETTNLMSEQIDGNIDAIDEVYFTLDEQNITSGN